MLMEHTTIPMYQIWGARNHEDCAKKAAQEGKWERAVKHRDMANRYWIKAIACFIRWSGKEQCS